MPFFAQIQSVAASIKAIQQALKDLGFDPGPIDGIQGAKTNAAIRAYRLASGMLNPVGTAISIFDPQMLAALFEGETPEAPRHNAPWIDIGWRKLLQHEQLHNKTLWDWLKFGRHSKQLGDPALNPWCGDYVETCISQALPDEPLPANPYLARDWLKFGEKIADPAIGAIVVFYRGSKEGWSGHVGFYISEDSGHYHILGGNQSNRVSIARLSKSRLLGYRWPSTFPYPGVQRVTADRGGTVSVNEA